MKRGEHVYFGHSFSARGLCLTAILKNNLFFGILVRESVKQRVLK